ncbi:uncharacterized protein LOC128552141 [Mercenaria mercenaria]|uniref:uncharacterized protein LOC128552141 n=1 Tax=Mercenaria mercenaria TaxID=6596 RepID=UPI00234E6D3D|nr:uncharacterized protein LOC128552141 [Mercenaria mercenaria]
MDNAIRSIEELSDEYKIQGKTKKMMDTIKEIEHIEKEYDSVIQEYHELISETNSNKSSSGEMPEDSESTKKQLDIVLSRQMKRVSIPVFTGIKRDYAFWKADFTACIDSTEATEEYKFLQMRQYLRGEALKAIEGLGHSALAYEKAKERLERKFGGERRLVKKLINSL